VPCSKGRGGAGRGGAGRGGAGRGVARAGGWRGGGVWRRVRKPETGTCQHRAAAIPPPPWLGKLRLFALRASNGAPPARARALSPSPPGEAAREAGADGAAYLGGVPSSASRLEKESALREARTSPCTSSALTSASLKGVCLRTGVPG
jgi:hypothetical protein